MSQKTHDASVFWLSASFEVPFDVDNRGLYVAAADCREGKQERKLGMNIPRLYG